MSGRGRVALEALCQDPDGAGLILDFDGVLSPIIGDPTASRLPEETARLLAQIAKRLRYVALISGRQLDFLIERASIPGVNLLGSYGVESLQKGTRRIHPDLGTWLEPVKLATARLTDALRTVPGIFVEDKTAAVAVHWRHVRDVDAAMPAVRAVVSEVAEQTGLRREPGKFVDELRPPLTVDKGTAMASLVAEESLRVVAYGGDDVGDIPAFRAALSVGGHALLVDHGNETDDRLRALATDVFDGVDEFAAWLRELATRLEDEVALST